MVGSANFVAAQVYTSLAPFADDDPVIATLVNLVVNAGMMGWGLYIGSRRELLWSLRNARRAGRARAGAARRPGPRHRAGAHRPRDARRARPPHHPGVHAGRRARVPRRPRRRPAARGPRRRSRARPTTRSTSCATCSGVLREDDPGPATARPQPTYDDIAALVDEAQDASGSTSTSPTTSTRARRCRRRPDAPSTGSCRRASPTCASTPPAPWSRSTPPATRARASRCGWATRSATGGDRAAPARPGPGSAWSACASAPSCAAAGSTSARRARTFVLEAWLPWTA